MKEVFQLQAPFNLENINDEVARYEVPICYEGIANNFEFSKEVLDGMIDTIKGARVLTVYDSEDDDFMGHEDDIVTTKEGYKRTPKPWVIGFAAYDCDAQWKDFTFDGVTKSYLTAIVYVWKDAFPYLQDLKSRKVFQSMECDVNFLPPDSNGVKKVTAAKFSAITLLGSKVQPAFDGSTFIKFSSEDYSLQIEKMKKQYELFKLNDKYSGINFTIPQEIKDNAQNGLSLRKQFNRGGTKVGINMAKYIVDNDKTIFDKVKKINQYFSRHNIDEESDSISNTFISSQLWGGLAAKSWSENLIKQIKEIDNKEQFTVDGGSKQVFDKLSMQQLCEGINKQLINYLFTDTNGWTSIRYDIKDLKDDVVILKDYQCKNIMQFPYSIDNDNCVIIDMNNGIEVLKDYLPKEDFSKNIIEKFIAKDQLGTKDSLKIDTTKDAISEDAWGEVDKSELKKDCLMAKNYKTICPDVFLQLTDGWEDGKEGSLGYPVMQNKNGTLVYNRYGLASAKAYAEKNNENAILAKVNDIYKKLGLDETSKSSKDMPKDNKIKKGDAKMAKDYKELYSKMKEDKSKFSFDMSDDVFALLDSDAQCIYLLENGEVTKMPFITCCEGEADNDENYFSLKEDSKEKTDNKEMFNKIIEMSKENKKTLDDKDAEIGKAFSKISSLESALMDAQNASKENADKLAEYEKQFKQIETDDKKIKMSKILEKKEFGVFSKEEKEELINKSVEMALDDFENKVYSQFGKRVKDTIKFSNDEGQAQVSFMYTESTLPKEQKEEADDIYAKIRKEKNIIK